MIRRMRQKVYISKIIQILIYFLIFSQIAESLFSDLVKKMTKRAVYTIIFNKNTTADNPYNLFYCLDLICIEFIYHLL